MNTYMKWIQKRLTGRSLSVDIHIPKHLVKELDLCDVQYFLFEAQEDGNILITPFRSLERNIDEFRRRLCQK